MALIEVDADGLHVLAARCQSLAGEIGAVSAAPSTAIPSGQATAAAVGAVHASVAAAGAAIVTRLETTSTELSTAASSFTNQEESSADAVAALAPSTAV
jgi:hypothetical protein